MRREEIIRNYDPAIECNARWIDAPRDGTLCDGAGGNHRFGRSQDVIIERFELRMAPQPGFDGIVRCQVLDVDPPRLLRYSWEGGWLRSPTTVTWELETVPEGTWLRLSHTGFRGLGGFALRQILGSGWGRVTRTRLLAYLDHRLSRRSSR